MRSKIAQKLFALILTVIMAFGLVTGVFAAEEAKKPVIGITWKSNTQNYEAFKKVIELAGGIPVELGQITSKAVSYDKDGKIKEKYLYPSGMLKEKYADVIKANKFGKTNVADVMKGVDAVFFTGGEDISPSLFKEAKKEENCGEGINATRDISDYTLMSYCIENNMPLFAVCRGEQMLGIVSGCKFLQDIPNYYKEAGIEYNDLHRMPVGTPNRTYARHDVEVFDMPSHLYSIVGSTTLPNVSSWHHQAVLSIEGTNLVQTAKTVNQGIEIIEGIERADKDFVVGVQFHPENDVKSVLVEGKDAAKFCNTDISLKFFKELVAAASK